METILAILRALLGMVVMCGILYALSMNRKHISWKLVVTGILLQLAFGLLVLAFWAAQILLVEARV